MLSQPGPRRTQGFTLIEMMVVVAIVGILLAVGAPAMHSFIQNQQIRSSAEELQAGLSLARNEALRRNARVSLWLVDQTGPGCVRSANGAAWVVSQDNPAGLCDQPASDTSAPRLVQSRDQGDSGRAVIVAATDASGSPANCITFNGFGMAEAACSGGGNPMARIGLSQTDARALRLHIASGGAVKMCDPSMSDRSNPAACP